MVTRCGVLAAQRDLLKRGYDLGHIVHHWEGRSFSILLRPERQPFIILLN